MNIPFRDFYIIIKALNVSFVSGDWIGKPTSVLIDPTRYPRMSGPVIQAVGRMMRSLVAECGVAAMLKPWGMRRAGSRTPAQRHHLRSRFGQMP